MQKNLLLQNWEKSVPRAFVEPVNTLFPVVVYCLLIVEPCIRGAVFQPNNRSSVQQPGLWKGRHFIEVSSDETWEESFRGETFRLL